MLDQRAEHAAPARQIADRAMGLLVDAGGEEALELRALLVEDAERGVARAGELSRGLQHAVEHRGEIELRHQRAAHIEQAANPLLL